MRLSRRKKHEEHVNHERWLVSYADFITLLFAFFVVMFASSQVDKRKAGKVALAIQVAFQEMGIFETSNTQIPMLAPEQMAAAGYAEHYPVAPNDTPQNRAQNRRVDIVVLSVRAPLLPAMPRASPEPPRVLAEGKH
jgi:chemotaxis protein MotB